MLSCSAFVNLASALTTLRLCFYWIATFNNDSISFSGFSSCIGDQGNLSIQDILISVRGNSSFSLVFHVGVLPQAFHRTGVHDCQKHWRYPLTITDSSEGFSLTLSDDQFKFVKEDVHLTTFFLSILHDDFRGLIVLFFTDDLELLVGLHFLDFLLDFVNFVRSSRLVAKSVLITLSYGRSCVVVMRNDDSKLLSWVVVWGTFTCRRGAIGG